MAENTNKSPPFLPKRPWSQRKSTLHVLGIFNKIKCTWLLDTGSDVTCVSSRLPGVGKWKLTPPQSVPSTANGSPLQCLGEVTASTEIGHVSKTNIRLLVIKNLHAPAILGMNTLEQFGSFGIDWTYKTLTLGEAKLVLEKRSHGSVLSPVVVSLISNHTIPPRSQCFVLAGTSDASTHDQDVLFSPFNDKLACLDVLLGASIISASEQNRIPVTVLNNSEHPVQIYAGTRVGDLSPVKVQEPTCHVNSVSHPLSSHPASPEREPAAVDLEGCDITIAEKHKLKLLLEEYRDVFANSDNEVGRTHRTQFHIHTKNQVNQQIKDMETRGIIEPSSSPYITLHLFYWYPKQTIYSYRFCADFRALNDATLSEVFPLPSVRECLDSLHGSKLFSTLDLYSGY